MRITSVEITRDQLVARYPDAAQLSPEALNILLQIGGNVSELAAGINNLIQWPPETGRFEANALARQTAAKPVIKAARLVRHLPENWTEQQTDDLLWATLQLACEQTGIE